MFCISLWPMAQRPFGAEGVAPQRSAAAVFGKKGTPSLGSLSSSSESGSSMSVRASTSSGSSQRGSPQPEDGCRALRWVRDAKYLPPQTRTFVIELAEAFRRSAHIGTKTYHLRSYHNVFVGRHLVDWLLTQEGVGDRRAAVYNAELLMTLGLIHHVCDDHAFKDQYLFYRFYADEKVEHSSVYRLVPTALHFGQLSCQGFFGTRTYFGLLAPRASVLYLFKNDIGSEPLQELELSASDGPCVTPQNSGFEVTAQVKGKKATVPFACPSQQELMPWLDIFKQHGLLKLPLA